MFVVCMLVCAWAYVHVWVQVPIVHVGVCANMVMCVDVGVVVGLVVCGVDVDAGVGVDVERVLVLVFVQGCVWMVTVGCASTVAGVGRCVDGDLWGVCGGGGLGCGLDSCAGCCGFSA